MTQPRWTVSDIPLVPALALALTIAATWAGCSSADPATVAGTGGAGTGATTGGSGGSGNGSGGSASGGASVPAGSGGASASASGGAAPAGAGSGGMSGTGGVGTTTADGGVDSTTGGAGTGGSGSGRDGGGGSAVTPTGGTNGGATDPGTEGDGDSTIGPNFTAAPESKGDSSEPPSFTLNSSDSAIYPSDVANKSAFTRKVWVYVPKGYVSNTEVPFMVVQDGKQYQVNLLPVLKNLIDAKKIPPMVTIFIAAGPGDGTGSERSLEYDKVADKYVTFVETEILPKVQTDYKVKLTTNPEGRAMMGGSSGGAAAFTAGWFRPDLYRRILTYSGSFVNLAGDSMYPHGAWEYHENLIGKTDAKPLRVFLECGSNDNGSTASATGYRNWVVANQKMAAALKAKGYHYKFVYADGAGHVDGKAINQTLADAMLWLWRGYVPPAN